MSASYLTQRQIGQLLAPIKPSRVSRRDGQSHLEAYDVRAHLDRVFGFARWDGEVVESSLIFEEVDGEKKWNPDKTDYRGNLKPGWDDERRISVGYRVRYRLIVKAPDGTELARYTEEAAGDATNFPGSKRADAHDFAVKTAESQAFKRCAINLGDQFGLSLYHHGSTDAVVTGTLVGLPEPKADESKGTSKSVDAAAPDVVPEDQQPPEARAAEEPQVSAEAQALADLAPRMPTVADLKSGVYDQAKAKNLLRATVADPVTGEMRPLSAVIADAKTLLTQQTTEGTDAS